MTSDDIEGGYCQITLDAKLASKAAPDLHSQIKEHRQDTIVLDASKVEQIGVLAMQIITSAAQTWRSENRGFEVVDPSPAFCTAARELGLDLALLGAEGDEETVDAA
jgi:anti-anti-sigma regulatory factor